MHEYIVPFSDDADMEKFEQIHGTSGEIIRCKDCMWGHEHRSGKYYICPLLGACFERDDFYCGYGIKSGAKYGEERNLDWKIIIKPKTVGWIVKVGDRNYGQYIEVNTNDNDELCSGVKEMYDHMCCFMAKLKEGEEDG